MRDHPALVCMDRLQTCIAGFSHDILHKPIDVMAAESATPGHAGHQPGSEWNQNPA